MADESVRIQVCYAKPDTQFLRNLVVPAETTLRQAVERSGLLQEHPGVDLSVCRVGIFGKLKEPDTVVREGDRIEIYRPLIADPKEARRKRAEKKAARKAT
jgi:putative ubiquitin-RnfH superfamily antitoxin RatB of RatAB toxin-antitoxin module